MHHFPARAAGSRLCHGNTDTVRLTVTRLRQIQTDAKHNNAAPARKRTKNGRTEALFTSTERYPDNPQERPNHLR